MNRKVGKACIRGEKGGLTRSEAERALRRLIEVESLRPSPTIEERPRTVDDVADDLRERVAIEGARLSYRQNTRKGLQIGLFSSWDEPARPRGNRGKTFRT